VGFLAYSPWYEQQIEAVNINVISNASGYKFNLKTWINYIGFFYALLIVKSDRLEDFMVNPYIILFYTKSTLCRFTF
jgi:hypothetical protein